MASQSQTKRKPIRRPGLAKFAREAGVTFSHARRCIIGERRSKSLMNRFRVWQRDQRAAKVNQPASPTTPNPSPA